MMHKQAVPYFKTIENLIVMCWHVFIHQLCMETTTESVLGVIKEASRKHFHPDPELGIDSIALFMGISVDSLMPVIEQLAQDGCIIKSRVDKKAGTKHAPAGNIRLRV